MGAADFLTEIVSVVRRGCMRCIPDGADGNYPPLTAEVQQMLSELSVTPRHLRKLFRTFQHLRSFDPLTLTTAPDECSCNSVLRLVRYKREWVSTILLTLLELGGYKEIITWNGFLYVLMKLCTLSKIELGQVLFYIICRDMQSWTVHYITTTQLQEFFDPYSDCPVRSFNTGNIGFSSLPLAKYTMVEFIELLYRYSQLINPFLHLQRALQQNLPGLSFWNDYDRVKVSNRRVTLDFFRVQKVKSLTDLVMGQEVNPDDENMETVPLQSMMLEHKVDPHDPKTQIKRKPEVVSDMPIPLSVHDQPIFEPGPPGFVPIRSQSQRRNIEPPMPAWLEEKLATNLDPVTGVNLGVSGIKKPPPNWSLPLVHELTTEETKAAIMSTHRLPWEAKYYIQEKAPKPSVIQTGSVVDWQRAEELDFIRKSRAYERQNVKVIDQINRATRCELIARPADRRGK